MNLLRYRGMPGAAYRPAIEAKAIMGLGHHNTTETRAYYVPPGCVHSRNPQNSQALLLTEALILRSTYPCSRSCRYKLSDACSAVMSCAFAWKTLNDFICRCLDSILVMKGPCSMPPLRQCALLMIHVKHAWHAMWCTPLMFRTLATLHVSMGSSLACSGPFSFRQLPNI